MGKSTTKNKIAARIPPEDESRVVELSMQNPEFGARRLLPLLKQDDIHISVSSVYNILKRNGLQNQAKRLARIKNQRAARDRETQQATSRPVEPEQIEKAPRPRIKPRPIRHSGSSGSSWVWTAVNVLLLLVAVYIGFQIAQSASQSMDAPQPALTPAPTLIGLTEPESLPTPPAFKEYSRIWERNLFNVSQNDAPAIKQKTAVEKVTPAGRDLGLYLVGTVVGNNPKLSFAFIDNRRTREQAAYQEGEKVGDVVIKKVLRNKVIIATADGERMLAVDVENSLQAANSVSSKQERVSTAAFRTKSTVDRRNTARNRFIQLDREEIEASLADTDRILREVKISPYKFAGRPYGFRIGNIGKDSVLSRMGLRSGVVITELNGQTITSPDQAAIFFQTLQEGGTIDFKYRRRLRTIRVNLDIG